MAATSSRTLSMHSLSWRHTLPRQKQRPDSKESRIHINNHKFKRTQRRTRYVCRRKRKHLVEPAPLHRTLGFSIEQPKEQRRRRYIHTMYRQPYRIRFRDKCSIPENGNTELYNSSIAQFRKRSLIQRHQRTHERSENRLHHSWRTVSIGHAWSLRIPMG